MNGDEEQIRFQLFKEDYFHVKLHNKEYENNKETFVTCVNQFSVMSQDEYLMKFTIQKMGSMSLNITEIIPEEMPPPSTLYAQKYGKLIEFSKQELVDCTPENKACIGIRNFTFIICQFALFF